MDLAANKVLQRLILVAASVVFILLLIELPVLMGMVDYRTVIGPFHMWWAPNIPDPELFAIHRPHARQKGEARGGDAASIYRIPAADMTAFQWDVKYDLHGFRNALDLQNADIVAIGDSFVEDLTVPYPELMTSRLAQLQGKVTANLGQSTYGPLQELVILKRYALPLRPQTILWMFSEDSDVEDVISYHRAMQNKPTYWQDVWSHSFTRNSALMVKYLIHPPQKPDGIKYSGVFQAADGQPVNFYFEKHPTAWTPERLQAIDETVSILATAQKLSAAQGARLIFVFIPMKFTVYHSFCRWPAQSKGDGWSGSDLAQRLRDGLAMAAPEVGFLDLTPALQEAARKGEITYYPDDLHWSPAGQKIAADTINQYLQSTGQ